MTEGQADFPLSPLYKPPTEDSFLYVRFLGNTARIGNTNFHMIDPFQMFALAEWLIRKGNEMLDQADARALAIGIRVTDQLPGETVVGPDGRPASRGG